MSTTATSCIPHSPASRPLRLRWLAALTTMVGPDTHAHTVYRWASTCCCRSLPKWAFTGGLKRAARPDDDTSAALKQRTQEGKRAPPQPPPAHRERKRQRGEVTRKGEREAATGRAGRCHQRWQDARGGGEEKRRRRKGNNGIRSSYSSASSCQRKRRGRSFIEQEESDNANGLVEHATAVDTEP